MVPKPQVHGTHLQVLGLVAPRRACNAVCGGDGDGDGGGGGGGGGGGRGAEEVTWISLAVITAYYSGNTQCPLGPDSAFGSLTTEVRKGTNQKEISNPLSKIPWQVKEKIGNMVFAKSRCVKGVVLIA